jgi:cytochrome oxidase Cu insertion factor (SCO1/SenC/PrrC family)
MRPLQRIGISVVGTLALIATVVLGLGHAEAAADPFEVMGIDRLEEPVAAPDLPFQSLDGRDVHLHDLRGKVVLLGFFTTA